MKTKNFTALIVTFLMSVTILKAQDAIDKYFSQYADNPDFTSIVVSSKMFELFAKFDSNDPDSQQMREAIKGLKGIRILTYDQGDTPNSQLTNYKTAIQKVGKEYETLMSVDDKDEKVRFYIREDGDLIKELFMIVGGNGNLFMMSLVGDIDLEKISSLSKSMNIGGMNYLQNLNKKDDSK